MTVNCYLWVWAAPGFMEPVNSVIKLSPAARLPGVPAGAEPAPSVFLLNTGTQICTVLEWLLAWPPLPVVLHKIYLKILRCIFSSWISCWCLSRMGKVKPNVLLCPGLQELPLRTAGLQQDFPFPPWSVGGQGSNPGDEWHEVTHAPNPKHLTLENWLQF